MKRNKVFTIENDKSKELSTLDLLKLSGFSITKEEMDQRISGCHCECGDGKGEFLLLPVDSPIVKLGGKRYMICRNCGEFSHFYKED